MMMNDSGPGAEAAPRERKINNKGTRGLSRELLTSTEGQIPAKSSRVAKTRYPTPNESPSEMFSDPTESALTKRCPPLHPNTLALPLLKPYSSTRAASSPTRSPASSSAPSSSGYSGSTR